MKTYLAIAFILLAGSRVEGQVDFDKVSSLPCYIIPAGNGNTKALVFFISGDGGYTSFDKSICNEFANKGYPVIALDAFKYFWSRKEVSDVVKDVQNILSYYQNLWHKSELFFVGYSFGADAIPVIVNRLEERFKSQTKIVGLLSPSTSADLEIHFGDMLSIRSKPGLFDLTTEINNLSFTSTICIFGDDEKGEIKKTITNPNVKFTSTTGGHRFNSNFVKLSDLILQQK